MVRASASVRLRPRRAGTRRTARSRDAVTRGSFWRRLPAAALRGLANSRSPASPCRRFSSSNDASGMNTSPRTSSAHGTARSPASWCRDDADRRDVRGDVLARPRRRRGSLPCVERAVFVERARSRGRRASARRRSARGSGDRAARCARTRPAARRGRTRCRATACAPRGATGANVPTPARRPRRAGVGASASSSGCARSRFASSRTSSSNSASHDLGIVVVEVALPVVADQLARAQHARRGIGRRSATSPSAAPHATRRSTLPAIPAIYRGDTISYVGPKDAGRGGRCVVGGAVVVVVDAGRRRGRRCRGRRRRRHGRGRRRRAWSTSTAGRRDCASWSWGSACRRRRRSAPSAAITPIRTIASTTSAAMSQRIPDDMPPSSPAASAAATAAATSTGARAAAAAPAAPPATAAAAGIGDRRVAGAGIGGLVDRRGAPSPPSHRSAPPRRRSCRTRSPRVEGRAAHSAVAVLGSESPQAPSISRAATAWSCTRGSELPCDPEQTLGLGGTVARRGRTRA